MSLSSGHLRSGDDFYRGPLVSDIAKDFFAFSAA